jgi:hypothetical protein
MAYGQTAVLQPDRPELPDLPSQTAPAAPVQAAGPAAQKQPVEPVTTPAKPVILKLASNDDLSVAAIARQANKPTNKNNDGEVVISLR